MKHFPNEMECLICAKMTLFVRLLNNEKTKRGVRDAQLVPEEEISLEELIIISLVPLDLGNNDSELLILPQLSGKFIKF